MKKMSDDELIDALNRGQTGRDIAEKYGYSRPQRISERIRELKDQGYEIRDTTSQASQGAGIQISIPGEKLEDLGIDVQGDLYYTRDVGDAGARIEVYEEEVEGSIKMSKISEGGDRLVYLTKSQLSKIGFESNEGIFVEKSFEDQRVDLDLYSRRVVEP